MPVAVALVLMVALMPAGRWLPAVMAYVAVLSVACRLGVAGALVYLIILGVLRGGRFGLKPQPLPHQVGSGPAEYGRHE